MLSLQSFLRKGVSLGYVGRNYNLKDLKDLRKRKMLAYGGLNENLKDLNVVDWR